MPGLNLLPEDRPMDQPCLYEIRIEGHLSHPWSDWFDGRVTHDRAAGVTILRGSFPDQAALLGLLNQIQGMNLRLISVSRVT